MLAHQLAVTHASCSRASRVSALPTFGAECWHLLDLALVLQMLAVVFLELLLFDDGFLVKETFRKGVVLTLNSLRFSLPDHEIQTCRLVQSVLGG